MTDEPSIDLPEGWRPEWGPPKRRMQKQANKRKKQEADADKFVYGEVILPKCQARKELGIKKREFDDALKREIIERIAAGELLSQILAPPEMPGRMTVLRMQYEDEQFAADMAMAREAAASHLADEVIEISDHAAEDYKADGSINYEVIARSKLRTDNRKWLIEKLDPKRWGSKGQIDVTSGGEKLEAKEINPLESARQVAFAIELAKRAKEESDQ